MGENIVTKLLDVLGVKLDEFEKGMRKSRFRKSKSREMLETSHTELKEQIVIFPILLINKIVNPLNGVEKCLFEKGRARNVVAGVKKRV